MKHPLTAYRTQHSLTLEGFGALVGATKSAVFKWEAGGVPRRAVLARIVSATNGALSPNDFFSMPNGVERPAPQAAGEAA